MALKLVVDALDGVDEAARPLYVEKEGKFHLDVDGLEDTSGLKSALEKERKAAKELQKEIKSWKSLGKTEDEIAELLKANEEAEHKKAAEAGDHAKILKQHMDKWDKEKTGLVSELTAARASERNAIISTSVMSALTKEGATEEGVDLLPDRLAARINFETKEGKRILRIMQADGETPMAGAGADGLATIDDLVKEAKGRWSSLFKGEGRSGSGKQPTNGSGGSPQIKRRSDFKDSAARNEWVGKHGGVAYAALPD